MTQAKTVLDSFNWRLLWLAVRIEQKVQQAETLEACEQLVDEISHQVAQMRWEYKTMMRVDYSDETDKAFNALPNFARLTELLAAIIDKHQRWTAHKCEVLLEKHANMAAVARRT